jgi:hypothetical protein
LLKSYGAEPARRQQEGPSLLLRLDEVETYISPIRAMETG